MAMIGHDVRGVHVIPTKLDDGSGMSGETMRGNGSWSLGCCLGPRQLRASFSCFQWIRKVRSFALFQEF